MEIDVHQPSPLPPPSLFLECRFPKWLPIIIIIIIIVIVLIILSISGSQIVLRSDLVPQVHPSHPRVAKVSLGQQLQTFG